MKLIIWFSGSYQKGFKQIVHSNNQKSPHSNHWKDVVSILTVMFAYFRSSVLYRLENEDLHYIKSVSNGVLNPSFA